MLRSDPLRSAAGARRRAVVAPPTVDYAVEAYGLRKVYRTWNGKQPNTDDMREASSLVLSARLQGEGATVVAYDPVADSRAGELLPSVELADSAEGALADADAAILVTEWPEFAELYWEDLAARMSNPVIVDGRNFLNPDRLRAAGFTYEGIGRAATVSGDGSS